jgi:predicted PurR-regulated permease PerM
VARGLHSLMPDVVRDPPRNLTTVSIEIAPRSMALILATIALVWLAWQLWPVALVLVVALILAGTFNPVVQWMEGKGLTRTWALIILFFGLLITAAVLAFLTIPSLVEQFSGMVAQAPATRARLIAVLRERPVTMPLAHMVESAGMAKSFSHLESYVMGYASQGVKVLGYAVTSFVLAFYLLADGKRTQGVLFALVPRDYHMRLARILQNMETIVGGYMRGQVITCAAFGVFTFVLLLVCGVPNAMSLAVFAAFVDVIPFIGGMIVIVPAVLSALPLGLATAGVVLVALAIYIEFESRILVPHVYGQYLRLSSTTVILSLVAGGLLLGVLGALLALPIAAGLLMIVKELRVDLPGDDSDDVRTNARHARTEAKYEAMSAGATAPDAGEIARALAASTREADRKSEARKTVDE